MEDRETHRQTDTGSTKVFRFSFALIHYSLQAVPQRYCSKQVQWRRELEREKTTEKKGSVALKG